VHLVLVSERGMGMSSGEGDDHTQQPPAAVRGVRRM